MEVKLSQAVKMFFGNSSMELVYIEAIANALDANATEISIKISATANNKPESIQIIIEDNGEGFTEKRYKKFSKLLDVEENSHKGLGRLVYLCYFEDVHIVSYYGENGKIEFDFNEDFKEGNCKKSKVESSLSGTTITMRNYTLSKLKQYSFIQPTYLKGRILEEFYSKLFHLKNEGKKINISFQSEVGGVKHKETITNADILKLERVDLESKINLVDTFHLYYAIEEVDAFETSFVAAISVDQRTKRVDIISEENIPSGYKMIFLLYSDWFTGKVDASRQSLTISDSDLQLVQTIFREKVASLIEDKIPKLKSRNRETKNNLIKRYPHLSGYFSTDTIGYASRSEVLRKAQDQFFKAQKDILEANSLTDEQYEKSLELSSRALTEYILFRQITIDKLKQTTKANSEAELHKLFASMKVQFDKNNVVDDIYVNNAWLLDDKYMTYETILSDREMGELVNFITEDEVTKDDDRPDIALVFSNDPSSNTPFDVVIVELKKRGLSVEENLKVITQLEKRARKLMTHYKNKIQRIWYYGIIEFNDDVELALAGEYTELYSSGKMYYRETGVAISKDPLIVIPIGVFIWDMDAVVGDAEARNSAFLNLIKSKFTE